jgi:hypothetical protein
MGIPTDKNSFRAPRGSIKIERMPLRKSPCGCGGVSLRSDFRGQRAGGVNQPCHGFLGGVTAHQSHIVPNPRIVLVYWDQYFTNTPAAVTSMDQFVSDLATGGYWGGLGQYGVGGASLQGHAVINMKTFPTPNSQNPGQAFSETQMQSQLIAWLDQGVVTPKPAGSEENLVYLIVAPSDTTLSLGGTTGGFCGYHQHGKYNASTSRDNLIWGTVQGYSKATTGQAFVDSISYCVSHELSEAFSNPDGQGYFNDSNGCEIGDICEAAATGGIITVPYKTWQVERYWSNMDAQCISGPSKRWQFAGNSKGFGDLIDGSHPIWIADFTGAGHAQVMFYYKGDGNWWLGSMVNGQLNWSLVNQSAGFGNLIDGNHPIWIADFTGAGHAQVMFYYKGDGNWWLGSMVNGQLNWSLVSQSAGFGNLIDGNHPIWIADFTGAGHAQAMFYYKGDGNWWLGSMVNGQLNWSLVSQSAGFGNLIDGNHPIWIADFTGAGHAQAMFYYKGDGNWWLGSMVNGQLNWSLVSQSAGFGNLIDGNHPIWIADFTGAGHAEALFYYKGDGNWWLGNMVNGQLNWGLLSESAGFGNLIDGKHPVWIADFTGAGHAEVLLYYNGDGNWWIGNMAS